MLYVEKPEPVEAVFLDSIKTGLEFLNPGEYVLVSQRAIVLRHKSGELLHAHVGQDYILRTAGTVEPVVKEVFENTFISLESIAASSAQFTAHENGDDTWTVECDQCGPIGMCENSDSFLPIGMEHMDQAHGGLL